MNKRNVLLGVAVAGLVISGGMLQSSDAFAGHGHKKGHKKHGKKDGCKSENAKAGAEGKKNACNSKHGCSGEAAPTTPKAE